MKINNQIKIKLVNNLKLHLIHHKIKIAHQIFKNINKIKIINKINQFQKIIINNKIFLKQIINKYNQINHKFNWTIYNIQCIWS